MEVKIELLLPTVWLWDNSSDGPSLNFQQLGESAVGTRHVRPNKNLDLDHGALTIEIKLTSPKFDDSRHSSKSLLNENAHKSLRSMNKANSSYYLLIRTQTPHPNERQKNIQTKQRFK